MSASPNRVAVEVHVIAVPPYLAERYLKGRYTVTLDAPRLRELLVDVQGQTQADVLHHLTVTGDGGRRSAIRTSAGRSTLELSLRAAVAADSRSVRVALKAEQGSVTGYGWSPKGGAIGVGQSFTLPAGQTAVFDAGARTGTFIDTWSVPVLCDLPSLGWLFTGESRREEEERVLILVTPRVPRR